MTDQAHSREAPGLHFGALSSLADSAEAAAPADSLAEWDAAAALLATALSAAVALAAASLADVCFTPPEVLRAAAECGLIFICVLEA